MLYDYYLGYGDDIFESRVQNYKLQNNNHVDDFIYEENFYKTGE